MRYFNILKLIPLLLVFNSLFSFEIKQVNNVPKDINTISVESDNSLFLFTNNGTYSYNILNGLKIVDYFSNKNEVFYVAYGLNENCFIHSNYDFTISNNGEFKYFEFNKIKGADLSFNLNFFQSYYINDSLFFIFEIKREYNIKIVYYFDSKKAEFVCFKNFIPITKEILIYNKSNCIKNTSLNKNETLLIDTFSIELKKISPKIIVIDYENNCWILDNNKQIYVINLCLKKINNINISNTGYNNIINLNNSLKYSKWHGFFENNNVNYRKDVHHVFIFNNDTMIVGFNGFIYRYISYPLNLKIFSKILHNKYIYYSTINGIFLFNLETLQTTKISNDFTNKLQLYENGILYATNKEFKFIDENNRITVFHQSDKYINTFHVYNDDIYYSNISGVSKLNKNKNTIKIINDIGINRLYYDGNELYINQYDVIKSYKTVYENKIINYLQLENIKLDSTNFIFKANTFVNSNFYSNYKVKVEIFKNEKFINNYLFDNNDISFKIDYGKFEVFFSTINGDLHGDNNKVLINFKGKFLKSLYFKELSTKLLFILIILIILLILAFYIKHLRAEKIKIENENLNLKMLKAQIRPHFIYNTLNTLKSVVYHNQNNKAVDLIDHITLFLRRNLNSDNKLITTLDNELKEIENYLEIENFRMNNKIKFENKANDFLKINLPSNILQPIFENAIVHGLKINEDLIITLTIIEKSNYFEIFISNNGKLIDESQIKTHKSFALESIKKRLKNFNKNKFNDDFVFENNKINGIEMVINKIKIIK